LLTMETAILNYDQIELAFAEWASSQPEVRAVVVFGSRARTEHPASEWSDLDLMIVLNQPGELSARTDWLASIGEVQFIAREAFIRSDWIPLVVVFSGMCKVDIVFTLIPAGCYLLDNLSLILAASPYPHVFSKSLKVLYDRYPSDGGFVLPSDLDYSPRLPTREEFTNDVNLFWARAIHTAILIWSGERWRACSQLQVELKGSLLTFLERQARLYYGAEHKIWPRGCYMDDWANPRAVAELPGCYAIDPSEEPWNALQATCDLFHWLAVDIAERLNFSYPEASEIYSREWINSVNPSHLF
jgi:aminoglycoside 6-adenylyltransferase